MPNDGAALLAGVRIGSDLVSALVARPPPGLDRREAPRANHLVRMGARAVRAIRGVRLDELTAKATRVLVARHGHGIRKNLFDLLGQGPFTPIGVAAAGVAAGGVVAAVLIRRRRKRA